ncbi:MAG: hypothetical protein WBA68_04610 [Alteraurantiacibacter sp.]
MRGAVFLPMIAASLALSACTLPLNHRAAQNPLTLAADRDTPLLALLEYRAERELADNSVKPRTTCLAQGRDGDLRPLPAGAERRLILRLESVAPFDRCQLSDETHVDAITGKAAIDVTAWDLTCEGDTCTASAGIQRGPRLISGSDYDLHFDGYWRITLRDLGIVVT